LDTVIIRPRAHADREAVISVATSVRDVDGYPEYLRDDDFDRFLFGHDALAAWVAECDGQIVGQVALHPRTTREAMALASACLDRAEDELAAVARLIVDPSHRRRGVARLLLDAAVAETTRLGRSPLLDVATRYSGAINLYEANGWVRVGEVVVPLPNGEDFHEFVYVRC
jgi:GNAT superfamily N-acetyltransferase